MRKNLMPGLGRTPAKDPRPEIPRVPKIGHNPPAPRFHDLAVFHLTGQDSDIVPQILICQFPFGAPNGLALGPPQKPTTMVFIIVDTTCPIEIPVRRGATAVVFEGAGHPGAM